MIGAGKIRMLEEVFVTDGLLLVKLVPTENFTREELRCIELVDPTKGDQESYWQLKELRPMECYVPAVNV